MSVPVVTVDEQRLVALVTNIVSKIISEALTEVRKGQAIIVDQVEGLSNNVTRLKITQEAVNQTLAKLESTGGKRSTVVYVDKNIGIDKQTADINKTADRIDLFGNATN